MSVGYMRTLLNVGSSNRKICNGVIGCVDSAVEIVVQVNGKIRARINVPVDIAAADAIALAKGDENVAKEIDGKTIVKELYVPKKLVNIVVR